jgi:hypothetical protein
MKRFSVELSTDITSVAYQYIIMYTVLSSRAGVQDAQIEIHITYAELTYFQTVFQKKMINIVIIEKFDNEYRYVV